MSAKRIKEKLQKLENLLEEAGYLIRFEKGNFSSGYCVLEHKKVIVINRFLDTEGRIGAISDLLPNLKIDNNRLSPESKRYLQQFLEAEKKFY